MSDNLPLSLGISNIDIAPELCKRSGHQSLAHLLFEAVANTDYAILLDTCNNRLSDGRYDIIVYAPDAFFEYKDGRSRLHIESDNEMLRARLSELNFIHDGFSDLSTIHKAYQACFDVQALASSPLPFLAGALGCFAYDINTITDSITDAKPSQYQMADIALGFYSQSLIVDSIEQRVYHIHPQAESKVSTVAAWLAPFKNAITRANKADYQGKRPSFSLCEKWRSNVSAESYDKSMQSIDAYLRAGDCYQVNYAQRFQAPYQGSEWEAYQALTQVNHAPFSAFVSLPQTKVLSVSPERFLQVNKGKVVTKPIKGTRKRSKDKNEDDALAQALLNSEKDKAENLMIVDLLRNDISKHCKAHSVKVPHLFALESYPAVHHMVSTVIGELKDDSSCFELLAGAFPGGSITGAPKVRAMQIIQELEPDKRSIYCGSIGYVGLRDDMDTSICIRTILAENNIMYCWAGGGIVLDSESGDEYAESFHKLAKILPVLESRFLKVEPNNERV